MKKFLLLGVTLVAVISSLFFFSCSKDDEGSNALVGTWVRNDYYGNDEYVMFCSNGTMYVYESCSTHGLDVEKGDYVYNEKKGTLIIDYDGDVESVEVISVNSSKLVIGNGSGETLTLTKTSQKYSASQLEKYLDDDYYSSSYYYSGSKYYSY